MTVAQMIAFCIHRLLKEEIKVDCTEQASADHVLCYHLIICF